MCPKVRNKNDIGRRLAVRIAMGCQIGALPCTPFASSRRSPQGETRSMERKNRESYISCTIPQFPPLVVNAVSQPPECVSCHMTQKVNSRNADFIFIVQWAIPQPSAPQALSPPERKRRNPFTQSAAPAAPLFYNLRQSRHYNPRPERPSNLRTLRP